MIPLGPFDLDAPAAHGGMAEVWRATHRAQRAEVAVKVLTGGEARDPDFLARFRGEVRAVAGLHHAAVVTIFDHGAIPDAAAEATGGRLVAGSPYLVMEWASGGSLASAPAPVSWSEARVVLETLLAALAHAHARGVLHRDLKPGNVLRCLERDRRPGLKLADFGVARPRELQAGMEGSAHTISGTLPYMAPEQALGRWRDEGPWTDLYSLGCVAFQLVTGAPPIVGDERILLAHAERAPPPRMWPRFPVPEGVDAWVDALLAKDPALRFQHAADAALALAAFGDAPEGPSRARSLPPGADEEPTQLLAAGDVPAARNGREPHPRVRPPRGVPVPAEWRLPHEQGAHRGGLDGAGMGLFGLRPIPIVGRDDERDRLWSALVRTAAERRARAVVLEGPTGCGKSRLAEWLSERAMELGAATPLAATHGPRRGPTDGLAPMLARRLGVGGLSRRDAEDRIAALLEADGIPDPDEPLALTELVAPAGRAQKSDAGAERAIRFGSASERHEVVRRHLQRVAGERPVVLWIDDAQWGADALAFTLHLLRAQARSPSPILVVASVLSDALPERPIEAELYAELLGAPGVERLEVGPLAEEHWAPLVRELLGLEGQLALRVERQAAGNPLFAVQLVGEWVHRGVLRPGRRGFRLRKGARADVPESLARVWSDRVERLLERHGALEGLGVELAAVLGQDVDAREWEAACRSAEVPPPWTLVEELLDRRLARSGPHGPRAGWSFGHAMLRESLERRAAERGRLARHHRTCARVLRDAAGPRVAERLGRHLLGAGETEAALGHLLAGAAEHSSVGDIRVGIALLGDREEALRSLGAPDADPRWGEGWAQLAVLENQRGRLDEALRWALQAERGARAHGWRGVLATALLARGRVEQRRGKHAGAEEICAEALAAATEIGDRDAMARCLHWLGVTRCESGDAAGAAELAERSRAIFAELGDLGGVANALYELGLAERRTGHAQRAHGLYVEASELYARAGLRAGAANAIVALGEIAREGGDYDSAEHAYRKALAIYEAVGSGNAMIARLNVGLALLGRGEYVAAKATFEETLPELERAGWNALLGCSHVEILTCCAAVGDWDGWDAHQAAAAELLRGSDIADPDLAWAAALAGRLALAAGQRARARAALSTAADQHRRLGKEREALEIEAELAELAVEPAGAG